MVLAKPSLIEQAAKCGVDEQVINKIETLAQNVCERKSATYRAIPPVTRIVEIGGQQLTVKLHKEITYQSHNSQQKGHERVNFFKLSNPEGKVIHVGGEFSKTSLTENHSTAKQRSATTKILKPRFGN